MEHFLVPLDTEMREALGIPSDAAFSGDRRPRGWLQHMCTAYDWHWRPGRELIWSTIEQVCKDRTRNPVRDYLKGLSWDGVPRCDRWLIDTFGVEDNDVHRTYALRWCIGLVARVFEPGCKLDTMLVLTGPQGAGKSTAFRRWATVPEVGELFSDTRFNLRDKDAYLQIYSAWLYEDAELSGYNAADKEARKGFLSSLASYIPGLEMFVRELFEENEWSMLELCIA